MLPLADARWRELHGGYRTPFDPRAAMANLELGRAVPRAWEDLWQELHHQGDVDTASYAAVPHLLRVHISRGVPDWNTFALVGCIEQARHSEGNPDVPEWLRDGYEQAWRDIVPLALGDLARSSEPELVRSAIGCIAMARGLRGIGEVVLEFAEDELREMVEKYRG